MKLVSAWNASSVDGDDDVDEDDDDDVRNYVRRSPGFVRWARQNKL